MAPEYIVTGDVSPAADVYGLGLLVWEAAVGEVFGQPRLKPEQHQIRRDAQLSRIVGDYAPLVPTLRAMLAWAPQERPNPADVERELLALSDGMRGQGLRAWCGGVVPTVLASSAAVHDDAGLLGRQIALTELGGAAPAAPVVGPDLTAKVSQGSELPSGAPRPPAASSKRPSAAMLMVQGLIVGGGIGAICVLFVILAFLLRRYL
jgi:hypothetical protein